MTGLRNLLTFISHVGEAAIVISASVCLLECVSVFLSARPRKNNSPSVQNNTVYHIAAYSACRSLLIKRRMALSIGTWGDSFRIHCKTYPSARRRFLSVEVGTSVNLLAL